MNIAILHEPVPLEKIIQAAKDSYGDMVKAVVDIERKLLALGGELHADAEALLLGDGSAQEHLWGINIYPKKPQDEWIEFTSFINIRPRVNNRSMEIQDPLIRAKIVTLLDDFIQRS